VVEAILHILLIAKPVKHGCPLARFAGDSGIVRKLQRREANFLAFVIGDLIIIMHERFVKKQNTAYYDYRAYAYKENYFFQFASPQSKKDPVAKTLCFFSQPTPLV
jgi:hypothetical protein